MANKAGEGGKWTREDRAGTESIILKDVEKGKGLGDKGSGVGREARFIIDLGDLRRPLDLTTDVEDMTKIFFQSDFGWI